MDILKKLIQTDKDARKFGFNWPNYYMILDQIIAECKEVREDLERGSSRAKLQEEIGDLLHTVISLCIFLELDVEETIQNADIKLLRRMNQLKVLAKGQGLENLKGQTIEYMLNLWKEVKKLE